MAFCEKCGTALNQGAAFCSACGQAVATTATTPPETTTTETGTNTQTAEPKPTAAPAPPMSSNAAGALCYALGALTGVIFLLSEPHKRDKFVRFHALQAIFFHLTAVAIWVAFWLVSALLGLVTFGIASLLLLPVQVLLALGLGVFWAFLIYKAYKGELYGMPFFGRIAATASEPPILPSPVAAFSSYSLWFVTGIIFLLSAAYKNDKFVRFHALQSILYSALFCVLFVFWAVFTAILINLGAYSGAIWLPLSLLWLFGRFALYGGWFFLMYKAFNNESIVLPLLGPIAAKHAGLCVEKKADASPAAN